MIDGLINRFDYTVQPQDLDGRRHFRAVALERALLNTAGYAANERNFGAFKMIDSGGASWILLKIAIEMSAMPVEDETIHIDTWVEKVNRLLTTRNYVVKNGKGDTIGYATSEWTMLDLATRRPYPITTDNNILSCVNPESVPVPVPGKLPPLDAPESSAKHTVKVSYSDIDYNGHTNSMQYLQWMLDAYPIETLYERQMARLEIVYMHEVRYGMKVNVFWEDMSENETRFAVSGPEGDCVRARIVWKQ